MIKDYVLAVYIINYFILGLWLIPWVHERFGKYYTWTVIYVIVTWVVLGTYRYNFPLGET